MNSPAHFRTLNGQLLPLPVFFPDATRAVLKTLDSTDLTNTKTKGVLVNTLHLYNQPGLSLIKKFKGVRPFMNWGGGVISDSGGFQVMSLAKEFGGPAAVSDKGVIFKLPGHKKILFTPEMSIKSQMELNTDMVVVLDDFTPPKADRETAQNTVERTIKWAIESKKTFDKICRQKKLSPNQTPYLLGVVQGGDHLDQRKLCTQKLVEIGFDGLGYGGWPIKPDGSFNYEVADTIRQNTPKNYLLYGLGVGKPQEIVSLSNSGWHIFDCVLPTRDARHKRLYVYDAKSIGQIDLSSPTFYHYYTPDKEIHYKSNLPVSSACDCHLCQNYSRAYLGHLFRIGDSTAGRLATIHNLRFYSILMEILSKPKS